jgi:diacylglycerol kinase (ATP)
MPKKDPVMSSFKAAVSGLVHTFRSQRHMRIHLFVALVTVLGAVLLNLHMREILILLFMITFVLVAEMFNSAIEATVDLVSPGYHPQAKFAKDIAAGAVLITTIMAIIVGSLIVIGDDQWERLKLSLTGQTFGLPFVGRLIAGGFLVFLLVIIGKGLGGHGRIMRGGLVSGHSALGFFLATSVFFLTDSVLAGAITVLLAIIIAQSRWEGRIHSVFELTLGAVVGVALGLVMFVFMPK